VVILASNLEEGTVPGLSVFLGGEYPRMTLMISSCINTLITLEAWTSPGTAGLCLNSLLLPWMTTAAQSTRGTQKGVRICCRVLAVILAQSTWSFSKGVGAVGKILGDVGKFLKGMEEASEFLP
jgi:hypothetical protein